MTEANSTGALPPSTRLLLGIAAVGLIVAGLSLALFGGEEATGGMLIRVGVLLGAAWLVAPSVRRPSLATVALLVAGALVLIRPRLVAAVAVAALIWWMRRRQR